MASYVSTSSTVNCRVCQKEFLKKNYKVHLKRTHPRENHEDTTPYGQKTLSSMFCSPKPKTKDEHIDDLPGLAESSEIEKQPDVRDSSTRCFETDLLEERPRKRHESNESRDEERMRHISGDSGCGDITYKFESSTTPLLPPIHVADVPNNILNVKLDTVIKGIEELKLGARPKEANDIKIHQHVVSHKLYDEINTQVNILKHARSIDDILNCGFVYDKDETEKVICTLCNSDDKKKSGEFIYSSENGLFFKETDTLPKKFKNLKQNISKHLYTQTHIDNLRYKNEQM